MTVPKTKLASTRLASIRALWPTPVDKRLTVVLSTTWECAPVKRELPEIHIWGAFQCSTAQLTISVPRGLNVTTAFALPSVLLLGSASQISCASKEFVSRLASPTLHVPTSSSAKTTFVPKNSNAARTTTVLSLRNV
jgi:hypothetical protein